MHDEAVKERLLGLCNCVGPASDGLLSAAYRKKKRSDDGYEILDSDIMFGKNRGEKKKVGKNRGEKKKDAQTEKRMI